MPAAPTGLAASAAPSSRVDLSWLASAGATSYKVERSTNAIDFTQIVSDLPGTSFVDRDQSLRLPGTAGNFASTPNSAALSISGDLDLRVRVALDDWTPVDGGTFVTKFGAPGKNYSYSFYIEPAGTLALTWAKTATGSITIARSTVPVPVADGAKKWVRVTLDGDNGANGWDVKFYTSDDGAAWTQLGGTVSDAGITGVYNTAYPLQLGELTGNIYYAEVRNGINGTIVASPDFNLAAIPTFTDARGNVWTISGSGATLQATLNAAANTYTYRVRATDSGGDSPYSAPVTAVLPSVPAPALGTLPVAFAAIGATTIHDLPVAALIAPKGTLASGGPSVTVSWTYAQAQTDPQAWFRVLFTNDAGTVTHHDTGWLSGPDVSKVFNLVDVLPSTDTTDLAVTVQVRSDEGAFWQGSTGLQQFDLQWGVPTATITSPASGAVVTSSPVTATWTYSDTRTKPQGWYRLRLKYRDSGLYLYDTGFVAGAVTSALIDFTLSDLSRYTLELQVKNSESVPSAVVAVNFDTDLGSNTFTPLATVGKLYEVGINGVGYMLYDDRDAEQDFRYQRAVVPLDPQRFATTSTPLSQSVERYLFLIGSDWKGGAGQRWGDRRDSAEDAFLDSAGVNPFERGRVTLLNSTAKEIAETYASLRLTTVGTDLYVQTGPKALQRKSTPGGAPTAFSIAAATQVESLTGDGVNWYAGAGDAGIFRGAAAVDPGAAWSAQKAFLVGWAGNRICAAVKAGTSSTANRFTTLNDSGVEEVSNGRLTLPAGWAISGFASGSGFVFVSAYSGDEGAIYAWNLTTDAPYLALSMPKGDVPVAIHWYQGQVVIAARRAFSATTSRLVIYRCPVAADGALSPTLVVEIGEESPLSDWGAVNSITGFGRFVLFGWPSQDGANSGLGAVDLSTGGYAKWHRALATTGAVASVAIWQGRTVFAVRGSGVWLQSMSAFEASGWLSTSVADGGSVLSKVIDQVTLQTFPLPTGGSVAVEQTLDAGNSYTSISGATLSGAGSRSKTTDMQVQTKSIGLRVTLAGNGTSTPTLYQIGVRYHALGVADEMVQLPIDCGDQVGLLNQRPHPENGPGKGALRAKALQGLVQSQVLFQDIDYQHTKTAELFDVQQVQLRKTAVYDRNVGRNAIRMVAVVTLRRRAK